MLTVHHLSLSQSERVVWLCEELNLSYEFIRYERDPVTLLSPNYRAIYPFGTAPVITDGDLVLGESGAVVDYIMSRYGGEHLKIEAGAPGFVDYLYWFHFANGTMMAALNLDMIVRWLGVDRDEEVLRAWRSMLRRNPAHGLQMSEEDLGVTLKSLRSAWFARPVNAFDMIERHLGEKPYFAGDTFSAADIMMFFALTTMRVFTPRDYYSYPHLRKYQQRVGERPAYQRAMSKAEPDMKPLLD